MEKAYRIWHRVSLVKRIVIGVMVGGILENLLVQR